MEKNNPFARLQEVPPLIVTSTSIPASGELAAAQYSGMLGVPGGLDLSPHLAWQGAPAETKSFVVTAYDPDAPTVSGMWHWAVANIPATVTSLPEGAGSPDFELPEGAMCLPNESRMRQYVGAVPPAGDGPHRYFFIVSALDVESVPVPEDGTPGLLNYMMLGHVIARGAIVATGEVF
jgi:Raf kinase inhibitor-like YbhB/YbcL family protein